MNFTKNQGETHEKKISRKCVDIFALHPEGICAAITKVFTMLTSVFTIHPPQSWTWGFGMAGWRPSQRFVGLSSGGTAPRRTPQCRGRVLHKRIRHPSDSCSPLSIPFTLTHQRRWASKAADRADDTSNTPMKLPEPPSHPKKEVWTRMTGNKIERKT